MRERARAARSLQSRDVASEFARGIAWPTTTRQAFPDGRDSRRHHVPEASRGLRRRDSPRRRDQVDQSGTADTNEVPEASRGLRRRDTAMAATGHVAKAAWGPRRHDIVPIVPKAARGL